MVQLRQEQQRRPRAQGDEEQRDLLDGAGEALVLLGVVVLEADLQVHGLHELALLGLLGVLEHLLHALVQGLLGHLAGMEVV